MLGTSSGIGSSWQARCFPPVVKVPVQAPRPAEDLKSQQKTMPKTPELSHPTRSQGAGWARNSHGWSRSEVTRLGREVGRGALYTLCKFLLHIREAGGVKRRPSRKTLHSDPKTHLLEENREVEGGGPACWRLGDEGQGCQVVDGMIVPQPRDKGRGEESQEDRFSGFLLEWAGEVQGVWGGRSQPCHLGALGRKGLTLAVLQS